MDEDTRAFNQVMAALAMPKGTDEEKAARADALEAANLGALEVPWQVMRVAPEAGTWSAAMADQGNPASASDAGVGALALRARHPGRLAQRAHQRHRHQEQARDRGILEGRDGDRKGGGDPGSGNHAGGRGENDLIVP